jgi:hypothetical protein
MLCFTIQAKANLFQVKMFDILSLMKYVAQGIGNDAKVWAQKYQILNAHMCTHDVCMYYIK